jgi:HPt (histidine-containing phosphotransfer) domain-containing protein
MSNGYLDQDALDALDEVTGGDAEFLAELVDTFLEDAPLLLTDLHQAIQAGDAGEVRRLAHSLKGNGRDFGANAFAQLCETLEHDAADGNLSAAQELFNDIEGEFPRVQDALEAYINSQED